VFERGNDALQMTVVSGGCDWLVVVAVTYRSVGRSAPWLGDSVHTVHRDRMTDGSVRGGGVFDLRPILHHVNYKIYMYDV